MCHMTHGCEICNVRCMWLTSDHSATVAILLKTLGTQEKCVLLRTARLVL